MNIKASGDSWCDYPWFLMTGGGLPAHLSKIMGVPIENFAHAGDSTLETMGLTKAKRLSAYLPGTDIFLFSGGGDDIMGDGFCILLNENTDGDRNKAVNWSRYDTRIRGILDNYEDLLEIRDRIAPKCLVVTHSYDWVPACMMGKGIAGFLGPWLQPGLIWCGWTNPIDQAWIVKTMLVEYQRQLAEFAAAQLLHLHVNTQGTLSDADWDNEAHANGSGWPKLAQVINAKLLPYLDTLAAGEVAKTPGLITPAASVARSPSPA